MSKPRIIKATAEERGAYKGLYPLHSWVEIDGRRCALEDLRGEWDVGNPRWELMAPDGYHFSPDGCHSFLGETKARAIDRADGCSLVECDSECGRGEHEIR